jgi:pimeloyl-ACP methyl ester carboxylesterase
MKINTLLMSALISAGIVGGLVGGSAQAGTLHTSPAALAPQVSHHYVQVDDVKVFYREAGDPSAPTIVLLHGFPTSSLMYRNLIPMLADHYHVIAPDLPGFGFTESPDRAHYAYTFDHLAQTIDHFTEILHLNKYALEVFDYGAPVGWRLATAHPERITAIITQNGNGYAEGLSEDWNPIQKYWKDPSEENRNALRSFLKLDAIKWQYTHGVSHPDQVAPETYTLDAALVSRPGNDEIQLDLFRDYANNVARYPELHAYLRKYRPPLLAVWGKNDPFFLPAGAEAFKHDDPNAVVRFYDTGHFALETNGQEIGQAIHEFLDHNVPQR